MTSMEVLHNYFLKLEQKELFNMAKSKGVTKNKSIKPTKNISNKPKGNKGKLDSAMWRGTGRGK